MIFTVAFFFFYRVFFRRHWLSTTQQRIGGDHLYSSLTHAPDVQKSNERCFVMRYIILKYIDICTNWQHLRTFLISLFSRKHKILHFCTASYYDSTGRVITQTRDRALDTKSSISTFQPSFWFSFKVSKARPKSLFKIPSRILIQLLGRVLYKRISKNLASKKHHIFNFKPTFKLRWYHNSNCYVTFYL